MKPNKHKRYRNKTQAGDLTSIVKAANSIPSLEEKKMQVLAVLLETDSVDLGEACTLM